MPAPRRSSRRSGRPSGRGSGRSSGRGSRRAGSRRASGTLRKGPSRRTGSGRGRTDEEDEEDFYEPQKKNQTPIIIGACVGGAVLLILLLVIAAGGSSEEAEEEVIDPRIQTGIDEVAISNEAKKLSTEAGRLTSIYTRTRKAADQVRAYNMIDKAIAKWEILRKRHPTWTGLDYEISILSQMRIDVTRTAAWE